jgi:hypothetical protein
VELLAPRPTPPPPKLEDHSLSVVSDCLFSIFTVTLYTWRPFHHPQSEDAPCRGDRDPHHGPCRGDRDPLITVPCRSDRDPVITVLCRGNRDPLITVPCRGDRDSLITVPCRGDRDSLITVPCRGDRDRKSTRLNSSHGTLPWCAFYTHFCAMPW